MKSLRILLSATVLAVLAVSQASAFTLWHGEPAIGPGSGDLSGYEIADFTVNVATVAEAFAIMLPAQDYDQELVADASSGKEDAPCHHDCFGLLEIPAPLAVWRSTPNEVGWIDL